MPTGPQRCRAFSTAFPSVFAKCRKAPLPLLPHIDARDLRSSSHTSIGCTMLPQAVKNAQSAPPRRSQAPIYSSPSTSSSLADLMRGTRPLSQSSIGGSANIIKSPIRAQITTARLCVERKPSSVGNTKIGYKRTSSQMNGLDAVLSRTNSFQDTPNIVDLTHDPELSVLDPHVSISKVDFNPDDFDDDSDLDLDVEYPVALPHLSSHRQALQQLPPNVPQFTTPALPTKTMSPNLLHSQSSVESWSSSPISHKITPPSVAISPKAAARAANPVVFLSSEEASADANLRPAKRRTLPWLQKGAELPQKATEEVGSHQHRSGRVFDSGFENREKTVTPLTKNKSRPWDTTASAFKDQQKAFKTLQRKAAKEESVSKEDIYDAIDDYKTTKTSNGARPVPLCLTEEQQNVLNLVAKEKRSVFFTGSAGTGKSVLMRAIIADLRKMYARETDRVAVTASTGLAACNISGITLHSFAGIGLGKESVSELVKKINRNPKAKNRWIRTKTLVIDEISMVDGELFDKLEGIARQVKKNGRPFGGIQLVITGDFFQLPPVPDSGKKANVKFAFDADTWSTSINHTIGLTEVFRQRDPVFANMLNEMRLGKITDETVKAFRRLERDLSQRDALVATELFPTREEVETSNSMKMRSLVGKSYSFKAEDSGTITDIGHRDKLLSNCMAPPLLELKKGAQVMLIKNIDSDLVNGSLGTVVAFMSEQTFNICDSATFDMDDADDESREGISKLKAMVNKDLVGDTGRLFPVVRFMLPGGSNSRELLCQMEEWKIELPNGEVQAQRRQVPLILAWALSIHKAQGQTLERVKVDLRKVFENGQAYVALSRATSQEGLCVKNFNRNAVMAHPRVGEFYNSLYSVNAALKHPKVSSEQAKRSATRLVPGSTKGIGKVVKKSAALGIDDDEEEAMAAFG